MRLLVPLTALLLAAPLGAQSPSTGSGQGVTKDASAARTEEERAVLAVVSRLFDAMRAGDSAGVRAVFHPGAQLVTAGVRAGTPFLRRDSLDAFVRAVGTPHAEVWDERLSNERLFVDGPLAVVWTDYAFYAGKTFSHCGVNAFQLVRSADGWKIVSLADTRRRERCPANGP